MNIPKAWRKWVVIALAGACALALVELALPLRPAGAAGPPAYVTTGVYTTAHPTAFAAVKDFLDMHPEHPVQPIAYTHTVHLAKGLQCDFLPCGRGPRARGAHSRRDSLHDLPPGDCHRPA